MAWLSIYGMTDFSTITLLQFIVQFAGDRISKSD